jgi:hypothetical protein
MKGLPVGVQSFRQVIEGGYVYADKTGYIHDLVEGGKYYFLSRPRRFGKSLLVDTIAEVFSGDRELFAGLAIAGTDWAFESHPVVRIDMTQVSLSSAERLEESLVGYLSTIAQAVGVSLAGPRLPTDMLRSLIEALATKHGKRVVVLVDEYDKPIIDHIDAPQKAKANREVLGGFYGVLKGQDANLRFVLLTGVSKFTQLSLFSKLNNLLDLTLWREFAGICGITEDEFDRLFGEHVEVYRASVAGLARHPDAGKSTDQIRRQIFEWYDGYTWDGLTRVFNPFSLLSFFKMREFSPYWFRTGTPSFLMSDFQKRPWEYATLQGATISENVLDSHDIEDAPLASVLFQTGFLTVRSVGYSGLKREFHLGLPNEEVSQSFAELFLTAVSGTPDGYSLKFAEELATALDAGRPEGLAAPLAGLYASIPYQLHLQNEAYYHSVFLAVMQFLGFRVLGEVSVAGGRIDGVVDRPNGMSYVIEFKYTADESGLDEALAAAAAQIEDRAYAGRYTGTGRKVFNVAVAVAARGVVRVEAL